METVRQRLGQGVELMSLAQSLSSPKEPEKLWDEVLQEWSEFLEVRDRMSRTSDEVEKAQLKAYYCDELADVLWNLAKFEAFSNVPKMPEQITLIEQINQQKTFGEDIAAWAQRKFTERYSCIQGIESRESRDEEWKKIKQKQRIALLCDSKRRGVQALVRLTVGERQISFGSESDLQSANVRKILVNKGLKSVVFQSLATLSGMSEESVQKVFDRKDYAIIRVKGSTTLVQFVKGPEGTIANMKIGNPLETVFIGGTDTIRKLGEIGLVTSDEEILPGTLFWGKGEILCLSDKGSVDRMISGELPNRIITRGTPYLTESALKKSAITDVEILSTDSNVEGMISLSAVADSDKTILGTEVVETGRSVEINRNYILYWDDSQQKVLIYSPSVRNKDGAFPEGALYGLIDEINNAAVCQFVKKFQTPLDVSIGRLGTNRTSRSVLPMVKRVMEIMATSSEYQ